MRIEKKVLLIDDDKDDLEMLQDALKDIDLDQGSLKQITEWKASMF